MLAMPGNGGFSPPPVYGAIPQSALTFRRGPGTYIKFVPELGIRRIRSKRSAYSGAACARLST